ncbi:MAG: hypothetical protein V4484_19860 [Pseudomonadota bacterium]
MKTHEFAKLLITMSKALKNGPNVELEKFEMPGFNTLPSDSASVRSEDIPQALNMLVGLNNVPKQEWIALIDAFDFDIEVRPRDANRDIYGKLLKYLSDNPQERHRLVGRKEKQPAGVSNELADALTLLLR